MKCYIGQYEKERIITDYLHTHGLEKVVIFGDTLNIPNAFFVPYDKVIQYALYYKYLEYTDKQALFVWNDCMKTQKQNCLEYNCIRHCAEQTPHRLLFNSMPLIASKEDFMILYTILEPNPFVKVHFDDVESFLNTDFSGFKTPTINVVNFTATPEQQVKYQKIKEDAIKSVKRDPDIIPRRLLKYAESLPNGVFDSKARLLPHDMTVSVSDLKVDIYFLDKLKQIVKDIEHVKSKIQF